MITKIGETKSVRYFKRGRNGKSSAKCRMDQKPFQRAEELKPDLILLDIVLPKLNGSKPLGGYGKSPPTPSLAFISADNSSDTVQVALRTGAVGFIHKVRAHSELLPAIDAILRGGQFVSNTSEAINSLKPRL